MTRRPPAREGVRRKSVTGSGSTAAGSELESVTVPEYPEAGRPSAEVATPSRDAATPGGVGYTTDLPVSSLTTLSLFIGNACTMPPYDVIVVGLGGMGTAAAYHLARRGGRVLGLDRFPLAHDRGSSHGHTRLIRLAYFEHPDYVPLARRALGLWQSLEEERGRRLLARTGVLLAGPATSGVLAGARESANTHDLQLERLTASEVAARWPACTLPHDWEAAYEPEGGALLVEDCVRAHAEGAVAAGADLRHDVVVHEYRSDGTAVAVETDAGRFTAGRLLVCPGAWAAGLLQLPEVRLAVLRKSLFWYRPAGDPELFEQDRLPCFGFDTPTGFFYGTPAFDPRGVKIANHSGGRPLDDPSALDRGIDDAERAAIEHCTASHLPRLGHQPTDHAACLYTMSPDCHFLLGPHPRLPGVVVAAGFSGHGFKFASVVGEILADLALTGTTPLPIGFLRPDRFSVSTPS
jgi:sarcosine oxidase